MKTVRSLTVLGVLALLLLPAALRAQTSGDPDLMKQKQTISDIRNVGTAMYTWYKDEVESKRSAEAHRKAKAESEASSVDITAIPVISREELEKVLVPEYISSIPKADGWGHPYEFHLNTKDPNAVQVMGLRSAGKDGQFSGNVYEIGAFSPTDYDQDVSWVDGYFVHWPQKK
ncbi:MAG TPA: hypothetical protein VIC28_06760 [Thermoanaerobaculia bacterium]